MTLKHLIPSKTNIGKWKKSWRNKSVNIIIIVIIKREKTMQMKPWATTSSAILLESLKKQQSVTLIQYFHGNSELNQSETSQLDLSLTLGMKLYFPKKQLDSGLLHHVACGKSSLDGCNIIGRHQNRLPKMLYLRNQLLSFTTTQKNTSSSYYVIFQYLFHVCVCSCTLLQ